MQKIFIQFRQLLQTRIGAGLFVFVILVLIWQLVSVLGIYNPYLFPPPSQIASAFLEMLQSGEWYKDLFISLQRYMCGFILGNIIGIIIGLLTGRVEPIRNALVPLFNFFRSTPTIALIPLAIVWFGIGEQEKIFIITWGVIFPVWLNTHSGVSEVEKEYIWAARSLGAHNWNLYKSVYIPRALPFIIAGTRTSIATGFFALAASEMSGAFGGVAFRIFYSHQMFRTDKMMVSIITIGCLSLIFDRLFLWLLKRRIHWWKEEGHSIY